MPLNPRSNVSVDPEVLLDFFLTFARCEYSLKACGFRGARQSGPAAPPIHADWTAFAKSIARLFDSTKTKSLEEACARLSRNPPLREVLVGEELVMWDSYLGRYGESELELLLLFVRTRRNNLFHGGDFTPIALPEPAGLSDLLGDSLVLLDACLELAPDVRAEFEKAIL